MGMMTLFPEDFAASDLSKHYMIYWLMLLLYDFGFWFAPDGFIYFKIIPHLSFIIFFFK